MQTITALFFLAGALLFAATASAHPATGIVVDRAGNVYFSDLETIWKIDPGGKKTVFRAGVNGRHVHELAIDDEGNVYGADLSYNPATQIWPSAIWKMTPDGKSSFLLETTETPPRGMSVCRDRAGNMYLIDQNNNLRKQTLLLRRDPEGGVTTLAGSAYGHKDGSGTAAQFGSVGAMVFGPDGRLYLTDGDSVRRVTMEGMVTTVAKNLNFKTNDNRARTGDTKGSFTGLSVDASGNVFVADAGNRRLLKITNGRTVEVVYRVDPPFFPNGVFATSTGDVFVMEVGFTPPNVMSGPRIRRVSKGKNELLAAGTESSGEQRSVGQPEGAPAGTRESQVGSLKRNIILLLIAVLATLSLIAIWQSIRLRQAEKT